MNPLEDEESLSRRGFLVGTAGAAVAVGASATGAAQEEGGDGEDAGEEGADEEGGDGDEGAGEDGSAEGEDGGGGTETVEIGDNYFEPGDLVIEPGTTVHWEWVGDVGHNIAPTSQPEGAEWEGHPEVQDSGEYEHTFDVEGTYEYVCEPHAPGMAGAIEVTEDADQMGGGPVDLVPDAAWTLVIGTFAGMISTLSLAYAFMRYGGPNGE